MTSNPAVFEKAIAESNMYDQVIGPDNVSTVPLETINAYREHGDRNCTSKRMWRDPTGTGMEMGKLTIYHGS